MNLQEKTEWSLADAFRTAEWPTAEVLESLCVH